MLSINNIFFEDEFSDTHKRIKDNIIKKKKEIINQQIKIDKAIKQKQEEDNNPLIQTHLQAQDAQKHADNMKDKAIQHMNVYNKWIKKQKNINEFFGFNKDPNKKESKLSKVAKASAAISSIGATAKKLKDHKNGIVDTVSRYINKVGKLVADDDSRIYK